MMTDDDWMAFALEEARLAAAAGDVPVGAIIVLNETIIGRGRNRREVDRDPTAHAEVVALRAAATAVRHWRVEAAMFVTQEPCPMCAGALVNARMKRVVFGCLSPKAGAVQSLFTITDDSRLNHRLEVRGNVRSPECAALLTDFFSDLRRGPSYGS